MPSAEVLSEALLRQMLDVAVEEARHGMDQGGIPIGAALFHALIRQDGVFPSMTWRWSR